MGHRTDWWFSWSGLVLPQQPNTAPGRVGITGDNTLSTPAFPGLQTAALQRQSGACGG